MASVRVRVTWGNLEDFKMGLDMDTGGPPRAVSSIKTRGGMVKRNISYIELARRL